MEKIRVALIIEDDYDWQEKLKSVLREKNIDVLLATNSKDAQALYDLNSHKIGLIFVDDSQGMGIESRIEFIKNVRQGFNGPIIGSTGSGPYMNWLMDAGCTHKFYKDYQKQFGSFAEILEKILEK